MSTKKQIEKLKQIQTLKKGVETPDLSLNDKTETLEALYNELKSKGVGTNENLIYLSEGLYINSKGEIIDFGN
jgi:hypothetical protein